MATTPSPQMVPAIRLSLLDLAKTRSPQQQVATKSYPQVQALTQLLMVLENPIFQRHQEKTSSHLVVATTASKLALTMTLSTSQLVVT
jgi:hypothetical protein